VPVTAALIGGFSALADANPAVTVSQSDLAWTHDVIGSQLAHRSKLTEALAAYERALAIYQKLVAAESTGPSDSTTAERLGINPALRFFGCCFALVGLAWCFLTHAYPLMACAMAIVSVAVFAVNLRYTSLRMAIVFAIVSPFAAYGLIIVVGLALLFMGLAHTDL
jgi:hypothetical protein